MCDVSDESRLMKEEVFGPVTCVVPFKTEEEVLYVCTSIVAVRSNCLIVCKRFVCVYGRFRKNNLF